MDPDPCTLNVFYVKSPQAQKHRTPNESDLLKTLLLGQKGCSIDRKIASATFLLLHVFLMFLGPVFDNCHHPRTLRRGPGCHPFVLKLS